jgi:hypothetical protein
MLHCAHRDERDLLYRIIVTSAFGYCRHIARSAWDARRLRPMDTGPAATTKLVLAQRNFLDDYYRFPGPCL